MSKAILQEVKNARANLTSKGEKHKEMFNYLTIILAEGADIIDTRILVTNFVHSVKPNRESQTTKTDLGDAKL